jgi:GNAT superfamily N-acetyltransferase
MTGEPEADTDSFAIRPVELDDYSRWLPLWQGYNEFYSRSGPTALPEAVTQVTWARFFDHSEPMHAEVADLGGELVGLVHYLFHRTTVSVAPTCYLQDLFTSEAARGRGVGGALIEAVYARAAAAGAERVYWHTHSSNTVARRLYDRVAENSGFLVYRKQLQRR